MSGDPGENIRPAVISGTGAPVTSWPDRPLRHTYRLSRREAGLWQAIRLMRPTLPYAGARLAWLLLYSATTLSSMGVMMAGSFWLTAQGAPLAAVLWGATCLLAQAWLWQRWLHDAFFIIACGHVAVLTQVMTGDGIRTGQVSMLTYGRRQVTQRFRGVRLLRNLQCISRGVMRNFHATLSWIDDVLPHSVWIGGGLRRVLLRRATNYLDMAVLSYDFARQDADPARGIKDGLIYYCQNAKQMLQVSTGVVVLDLLLIGGVLVLLLPASLLIQMFLPPHGAALLTLAGLLVLANLRAAFIKPALLVVVLMRFHALAEGQVINPAWDERLSQISEKYRSLRLLSPGT